MANDNLGAAKKARQDEFYTQYADIEKEMNAYLEYNPDVFRDKTILLPCDDPEWSNFTRYFAQNFETFGLQKLISTSYAPDSKPLDINYQPTLFEMDSDKFDSTKTRSNGKIFTLTRDMTGDGVINVDDLEWGYLDGDGDFRSKEVSTLRDEADFVITNPPFSLFREFLTWVIEGNCSFSLIGNSNAITYKEVFPLIRNNLVWLGKTANNTDLVFRVPEGFEVKRAYKEKAERMGYFGNFTRLGNACWFTNIEHGRRYEPLSLLTMEENLKFSKNASIRENGYQKYDNYDAIEVPATAAIPSDYPGVMGVPISFLDKYNPDQFEILGITQRNDDPYKIRRYTTAEYSNANDLNARATLIVEGKPKSMYARILIRHKREL